MWLFLIVLELINSGLFFNLIINLVCGMEWEKSYFFISELRIAHPGDSSELPKLLLISLLGLPTLLLPWSLSCWWNSASFTSSCVLSMGMGPSGVVVQPWLTAKCPPSHFLTVPLRGARVGNKMNTGQSFSNCHGENRVNLVKFDLLEQNWFNLLPTKIESDGAKQLFPHPPFFSMLSFISSFPIPLPFFPKTTQRGWLRLEGTFGDPLTKYTTKKWKKATNYWINIWCLWIIKRDQSRT